MTTESGAGVTVPGKVTVKVTVGGAGLLPIAAPIAAGCATDLHTGSARRDGAAAASGADSASSGGSPGSGSGSDGGRDAGADVPGVAGSRLSFQVGLRVAAGP